MADAQSLADPFLPRGCSVTKTPEAPVSAQAAVCKRRDQRPGTDRLGRAHKLRLPTRVHPRCCSTSTSTNLQSAMSPICLRLTRELNVPWPGNLRRSEGEQGPGAAEERRPPAAGSAPGKNAQLAMTLRASCIASPVSSFLVDMSIFNVCMANGHVRVGRRGGPGSWSQVRGQGDP